MSPSPSEYRLIAREIAGLGTPEDRIRLDAWLAADPAHVRLLALLREAWRISGTPASARHYDADRDWPELLARIRAPELDPLPEPGHVPPPASAVRGRRGRFGAPRPELGARAVAAAAVVACLLLWNVVQRPPPGRQDSMAEVSVPRGGRGSLVLPDGSKVVLGSESRMRYSVDADWPTREVALEGMAYFEVAHDAHRPFLVHARGSRTRVLGTKFVVRAYRDAPAVEVAVAEGSVALGVDRAGPEPTLLVHGQVGRLDADGSTRTEVMGAPNNYFGWTQGRLVIDNRPLPEALNELGRWYDVELRVDDPELAARRITTTAGEAPIENVMASVALALGARYEQRGDTIVLGP